MQGCAELVEVDFRVSPATHQTKYVTCPLLGGLSSFFIERFHWSTSWLWCWSSLQDDKVAIVHFIGAFMVFGFGVVYEWIQLLLSYKIFKSSLSISRQVGKCILIVRLVFCLIGTFCFVAGELQSRAYRLLQRRWHATLIHHSVTIKMQVVPL